MTIPPISALPGLSAAMPLGGAGAAGAAAQAGAGAGVAAGAVDPAAFGNAVTQGLEKLQAMHQTTDSLAVQAVTGNLTDIHDYTIAANEAAVATQLTVAVRNKAVDAFTEIMRMPM
jgi:flagellar hook-basal body complex protein FliE